MKILVTGAKGFVGKNLCATLYNIRDRKDRTRPELKIDEVYEYDIDTDPKMLDEWCRTCDFVFYFFSVSSSVEANPKFPSINSEVSFGLFTPAKLNMKSAF